MVTLQLGLSVPLIPTRGASYSPMLNAAQHCTSIQLKSSYLAPNLCFFVSNSYKPDQYTSPSFFPPINQSVAAIIFGDGTESKLNPLTKRRSDGAIPIAANYRLVDIVISNCINSNISKIYAFTQFNSTSLNSHLSRAYSALGLGREGFVEVIAAYQSPEDNKWFQGSADAVRRCLWVLEEHPVTEFLVLPGHHLYKMNYKDLIHAHRSSGADITIAARHADTVKRNPGLGYLQVSSNNNVVAIREKTEGGPKKPSNESSSTKNDMNKRGDGEGYWSMGIYVIKREALVKLLKWHMPDADHFSTQVLPGAINVGMKVMAYKFDGYWEDMKNIEAFYQANMDIRLNKIPGFNFYDKDAPIYTLPRCLPPSMISDAVITESIIGDGCIINNCKIKNSVIGMLSCIRDRVVIEGSIIMGADIYQMEDVQRSTGTTTDIPIGIGEGSYIKKAIIDKNARIGQNVRIANKDNVQEGSRDANGYVFSGGIVTVLRGAVIPDNTVI
ncbi:hypothetical protein Syun_023330 [Stephania yunnanensis]|uniref:Nucleotidyl transferase domain-containing protein n=1 Tax=Stephania yunnanensis TaxID=152371 RepID=A0AAP0FNN9_9MAGN